jgi:hypothetical protein
LLVVEFTTADGTFDAGTAQSYLADGADGASGSFEGFLAGPDSTDIGANIVVEGPAYSQNVGYQIATYQVVEDTLNPITGDVISTTTTNGSVSGLTNDEYAAIQNTINSGQTVPFQSYNPLEIPSNAVNISVTTDYQLFVSEFDAREIGVLVAAQQ